MSSRFEWQQPICKQMNLPTNPKQFFTFKSIEFHSKLNNIMQQQCGPENWVPEWRLKRAEVGGGRYLTFHFCNRFGILNRFFELEEKSFLSRRSQGSLPFPLRVGWSTKILNEFLVKNILRVDYEPKRHLWQNGAQKLNESPKFHGLKSAEQHQHIVNAHLNSALSASKSTKRKNDKMIDLVLKPWSGVAGDQKVAEICSF